MSRQGDLSDPQHGGVRTTRRGDQDISAILGATQEICGKHSLIQYNGACQVEMREDDVVHIQDGDTRFKETLSTPQPAISFESVKTESSTSNGDSHRVGLEIETPHVGGQNSTYNIERYDSTSVDVVVRNVDEWLKHRSDSMSSIEFDGDMKTTEDYEFKLDTENETDAIEGESGSRVLATRDTNKPVREMDLFATPNDVSSQEVKDNVSCQRLQNNLEKRPGNEILTTNYDSSIVPQMAVMGSFTDETDATFSPQITPVATLTAFQPNSIACMETHSDLESFINQEAVACGHSTTTKDSGVESKSANMMNFCNTDIMLMTPQELERMPESGIEFEESVGPREFETSERPMDCEAENDGFERSASTGPIDIKEDGKGSEIITEVANNATTNPGSSTLATISISTDNETNTTNIVINTKLGQKAFKINTTNLMQAAATLQPITLADLVDQKGVTVLAEPQEETRQVDQNMQEERVDLNGQSTLSLF